MNGVPRQRVRLDSCGRLSTCAQVVTFGTAFAPAGSGLLIMGSEPHDVHPSTLKCGFLLFPTDLTGIHPRGYTRLLWLTLNKSSYSKLTVSSQSESTGSRT